MAGLVLLGCPREVQEAALDIGAPAVVFGGVFATTRSLPSVDVDQHEAGRLMARYVVERGHHRIGLITRDTWLPGDNRLLDGVNEVLSEAGSKRVVKRLWFAKSLPGPPINFDQLVDGKQVFRMTLVARGRGSTKLPPRPARPGSTSRLPRGTSSGAMSSPRDASPPPRSVARPAAR